MQEIVLVKTASEISLKSHFVRKQWTSRLCENIRVALKQNSLKVERIERLPGRLFLHCAEPKKAQKLLQKIFGVHAIALAELHSGSSLEEIGEETLAYAKKNLKKKESFALRVSRTGNHSFSSRDIAVSAGAKIVSALGAKVDLDNPKKEIFIEAFQDFFCIYSSQVPGPKGLPLGVEGKIALLLGNRKEDFLAGLLMLKRGCSLYLVGENSKKNLETAGKLSEWNCFKQLKLGHSGIEGIPNQGILAIAKSDSSVSEKAFKEYIKFDSACKLPVFRPLLLYPNLQEKGV